MSIFSKKYKQNAGEGGGNNFYHVLLNNVGSNYSYRPPLWLKSLPSCNVTIV